MAKGVCPGLSRQELCVGRTQQLFLFGVQAQILVLPATAESDLFGTNSDSRDSAASASAVSLVPARIILRGKRPL